MRRAIRDVAWEPGFEHERVLTTLIVSEENFERGPISASSLVANIRREGVTALTEAEKIRALVQYRIDQANEALRSARTNLAQALGRSAVNRAYYAKFVAGVTEHLRSSGILPPA